MINDIHLFLVHAIQLERDAARQYEDLSQMMQTAGNREVQVLFSRMGQFSRRHLADAMARGGFRELPVLAPEDFDWPDGSSPEAAGWQGVDGLLDVHTALDMALAGERSSHAFYAGVAALSQDPEVVRMAREFAQEESEHVQELSAWISRVSL